MGRLRDVRLALPGEEAVSAVSILSTDRRPFFTVKTLAEYLSLSEKTVRDMLARGAIASYKIQGSRRVKAEDVDTYLEERRDG